MNKKIIGVVLAFSLPISSVLAIDGVSNKYEKLLKSKLMGLNIQPLSNYPHLISKLTVSGDKTSFEKFDGVSATKRMIWKLLKEGVDSGNLNKDYLDSDVDWKIHEVLDMQPGWQDGYEKWYYPKYFAFSPKEYNKETIVNDLLADLSRASYPLENIYNNFDKIFNKETPVYLNDAMFYVDMDKQGFYLVNLLGLNRFGLPLTSSKTGSAIHLGKLKLDVTTLIHEYLHDKISAIDSRENSLKKTPLLGFKNNTDDVMLSAIKIRKIIDGFAADKDVRGTWWSPMANTEGESTSYSFTKRMGASDINLTDLEKDDVMYFMEELMVRIISQSLFSKDGKIEEITDDVAGLSEYFKEIGANKTLAEFALNFYGSNTMNETPTTNSIGYAVNSEGYRVENGFVYLNNGFEFTLEEYETVKVVLMESFKEIEAAFNKNGKSRLAPID